MKVNKQRFTYQPKSFMSYQIHERNNKNEERKKPNQTMQQQVISISQASHVELQVTFGPFVKQHQSFS